MLRGRDIKHYSYEWAGLWLINTHNGYQDSKGNKIPPIDIKDYPTLKAYFDEIGKNHKGKGKGLFDREDQGITPYNLRNCAYLEEFEKEKIVYPNMTKFRPFILDRESFYTNKKCFIITSEQYKILPYIIGILNSWIFDFAFAERFPNLLGGTLELSKIFFEKLPIPKIDSTNTALSDEIISLVEQILDSKAKDPTTDTKELEYKIDKLVYKLYN